jgi:hypothetical protein
MAFKLAQAVACMPKMAIRHFFITTPSRIATRLHSNNAGQETAQYLANISSYSRE